MRQSVLARHSNQLPCSSPADVGGLRLHMPAPETALVVVPVGLGPNPHNLLDGTTAVLGQILVHQPDASRVHKQPRRGFPRKRIEKARAVDGVVVGRREVAIWAGLDFDPDDVSGLEEKRLEQAEAAADGKHELRWRRQERLEVGDEGRAEGETTAGEKRGRNSKDWKGWRSSDVGVLSCHRDSWRWLLPASVHGQVYSTTREVCVAPAPAGRSYDRMHDMAPAECTLLTSNHGTDTTSLLQALSPRPTLRGSMARLNPFSFTPGPVIFFTSAVYVALVAALLVVHLRVPDYPSSTPAGINLTQAWRDLEHVTRQFHPYNSHANDDVRKYVVTVHITYQLLPSERLVNFSTSAS